MRADIGGNTPVVLHLRRRKARAHIFTIPGRGLVFIGIAVVAALIAFGVTAKHAESAPNAPFAWIGR
jgi:hypothetical protein